MLTNRIDEINARRLELVNRQTLELSEIQEIISVARSNWKTAHLEQIEKLKRDQAEVR